MADDDIWGVNGNASNGLGTGNQNGPSPDHTVEDDCGTIPPDVPATENKILIGAVKVCDSTDTQGEFVTIDDATYTPGSIWYVDQLADGAGSYLGPQCVFISTDYESTDDPYVESGFPADEQFPTASTICGGWDDCDDCNAQCYKITDCLTGGIKYSNNAAYAAVDTFESVVDGRCYTVATESDTSKCCPGNSDVTDSGPNGSYATCQDCFDAINPSAVPCTDCSGFSGGTLTVVVATSGCTDGDYSVSGEIPFLSFGDSGTKCTWRWAGTLDDGGVDVDVQVDVEYAPSTGEWKVEIQSNSDGLRDGVTWTEEDTQSITCFGAGTIEGSGSPALRLDCFNNPGGSTASFALSTT